MKNKTSKYLLTINDLKRELTEEEENKTLEALLNATLVAGDFNFSILRIKKDLDQIVENLGGVVYISNSIYNQAGAVWFPNKKLITPQLRHYKNILELQALTLTTAGEPVGVFQELDQEEKNTSIKIIKLDDLPEYLSVLDEESHEEKKRKELEEKNQRRKDAKSVIDDVLKIINKYQNKRLGSKTLEKIREEVKPLEKNNNRIIIYLDYKSIVVEFCHLWDYCTAIKLTFNVIEDNTLIEPLILTDHHQQKLKIIDVKSYRKNKNKVIDQLKTQAKQLEETIKKYNKIVNGVEDKYLSIDLYKIDTFYLDY